MVSHSASPMYCRPSASIVPQLGTDGGTPTPRKLSDASAMMLLATEKLAMTMIGLQIFGRICWKRMRKVALAGRARRQHELLLLHRQHLAAHDAPVLDPAGQPKDEDHLVQAAAQHRHDGESEQDRRKRQLDVGDAHDHVVEPAAEITRKPVRATGRSCRKSARRKARPSATRARRR